MEDASTALGGRLMLMSLRLAEKRNAIRQMSYLVDIGNCCSAVLAATDCPTGSINSSNMWWWLQAPNMVFSLPDVMARALGI